MYSAERSDPERVNMICCASVVFPAPGAPAIRLKENSGRPPPRISSSPGTPVGRRRMATLSGIFLCLLGVRVGKGRGPCLSQQTGRERFPDEGDEQPRKGREHRGGAFSGDRRTLLLETEDDPGKRPACLFWLARIDEPR